MHTQPRDAARERSPRPRDAVRERSPRPRDAARERSPRPRDTAREARAAQRRAAPDETLLDGTPIGFRPLVPDDAGRLAQAFDRLSPTSRYRRFLSPIRSLSDQELRRLTQVDAVDHVAWVAELSAEPERPFAGVGRWVRSKNDPAVAEIALTVVDAYQRRGLGRALLALLAESARRLGIDWFEAIVLGENQPMRMLLKTLGARQIGYDMGTYVFRLSVAALVQARSRDGAFSKL
jgi:RimJ/RimL family protein N-acetyltransferase